MTGLSLQLRPAGWSPFPDLSLHPTSEQHTYLGFPIIGEEASTYSLLTESNPIKKDVTTPQHPGILNRKESKCGPSGERPFESALEYPKLALIFKALGSLSGLLLSSCLWTWGWALGHRNPRTGFGSSYLCQSPSRFS